MVALGMPEGGGKPGKGSGSSYLAAKPPKMRAHLMDAVDPSLSQDERAEALCRAMEEFSGDEEADEAEVDDEAAEGEAEPMATGEDY